MKKTIIFVLAFILISFLPYNTLANEADVYANTTTNTSSNVVTSKLKNGTASFKVGKHDITIVSSDKNDNNDIIAIEVVDKALNWVKKKLNSYTINNAYYITFYKNGKKEMPNGKINVYFNNGIGKKIISIDLKGNIINTSTSNINITTNDQYIALANYNNDIKTRETSKIETKEENTIFINCEENGLIAIDGITYKGISQIQTDKQKVKVAIIPNYGYIVDNIYVNDINSNDNIKSGFILIDKGDSLKISFKKNSEPRTQYYSLYGKINQNGITLKNVKIIIDNGNISTNTDNEGYFAINNISDGHHTIAIYNGKNLIGFKEFFVKSDNKTEIEQPNIIAINNNSKKAKLDLNIDDYEIYFMRISEANKTNQNSLGINREQSNNEKRYLCIIITIILVLLIIFIIFIIKRKKKKDNSEEEIEILKI